MYPSRMKQFNPRKSFVSLIFMPLVLLGGAVQLQWILSCTLNPICATGPVPQLQTTLLLSPLRERESVLC